jgi:hypothetical protein
MSSTRSFLVLAAVLLAMPRGARAQDQPPPGWKWIADAPARRASTQELPDSAIRIVMMPPGWHLTTGPGALVFDPALRAGGRFTLRSEMFVFPQTKDEGYGLFLGGRALGTDSAEYIAVLLRADGAVSVQQRRGTGLTMLQDWTQHDSIAVRKAGGTGKNNISVLASGDRLTVVVNGATVALMPLPAGATDGQFGFRLGSDVNLHVSTLDLTTHIAPPRGT